MVTLSVHGSSHLFLNSKKMTGVSYDAPLCEYGILSTCFKNQPAQRVHQITRQVQVRNQRGVNRRHAPRPRRRRLRRERREHVVKRLAVDVLALIPPHPQAQPPVARFGELLCDAREYGVANRVWIARVWDALDGPRPPRLVPEVLHLRAYGVEVARGQRLVDAVQGPERRIACAPDGDGAHVGDVFGDHARAEQREVVQHELRGNGLSDAKVPVRQR